MTQDEIATLNALILRMPKGKRKELWNRINNGGYATNSPIDSISLRRSLQETERKGLRWLGLKHKEEVA